MHRWELLLYYEAIASSSLWTHTQIMTHTHTQHCTHTLSLSRLNVPTRTASLPWGLGAAEVVGGDVCLWCCVGARPNTHTHTQSVTWLLPSSFIIALTLLYQSRRNESFVIMRVWLASISNVCVCVIRIGQLLYDPHIICRSRFHVAI